jgi:hypothetical protein
VVRPLAHNCKVESLEPGGVMFSITMWWCDKSIRPPVQCRDGSNGMCVSSPVMVTRNLLCIIRQALDNSESFEAS